MMSAISFDTPVVMIVFNRPATTRRVFDVVSRLRPKRLLIVADGPRAGNNTDVALCAEVRDIVQKVDWPCTVLTNFSDWNLGCQERVVSGLDWAFTQVDEGVILEDDCLPDESFFPFCEELLSRYRGDSRVAAISGTNFLADTFDSEDSYYFSRLGGIWGWATWRTEWQRYDRLLKTWPDNRRDGILQEIFTETRTADYWTRIFDAMHEKSGPSIWDYQWLYTHLVNNSMTIVPRVNLVENIGFGPDSTNTRDADARLMLPGHAISFPLVHPLRMVPSRTMDRRLQTLYQRPINERIVRKVRRVTSQLFGAT